MSPTSYRTAPPRVRNRLVYRLMMKVSTRCLRATPPRMARAASGAESACGKRTATRWPRRMQANDDAGALQPLHAPRERAELGAIPRCAAEIDVDVHVGAVGAAQRDDLI